MLFILESEMQEYFERTPKGFAEIMSLRGEVYRELEGRRTQKIVLGQKNYFIKQHFGVGWKEIIKNLFQLRLPVISARNEWHALKILKALKIPTLEIVAYGCKGINPARMHSFLMTRELPRHRSLEDFCKDWAKNPPQFKLKKNLIKEVARIARQLHQHGMNHRDFYICHFLLHLPKDNDFPLLYLIDLHRAQIRKRVPVRWRIKDLAGLYFSSKEIGLTTRDLLRFMKEYCNKSLRESLIRESTTWIKVKKRGDALYRKQSK